MLTTVQDILRIKGPQVWSISPEATVTRGFANISREEDRRFTGPQGR